MGGGGAIRSHSRGPPARPSPPAPSRVCSYTTELEQERHAFELLHEEKLDIEREYAERMNAQEISHRAEMQKRESLYQARAEGSRGGCGEMQRALRRVQACMRQQATVLLPPRRPPPPH